MKAPAHQKADSASRRATGYRVTASGRGVTDRYAALRAELLVPSTESVSGFGDAARLLDVLSGLYDQATTRAGAKRYTLTAAE